MSFNQPGPYGQPPQGPNPYAQAPAQAPQPQPQPQYAQAPMPPMPPAMPPSMPPQGTGTSKGKAIGIAVTAVVLVGAIAGGGWMLLKGDDKKQKPAKASSSDAKPAGPSSAPSSAAPAGKRYKLVAPDKVADIYAKDPAGDSTGFDSGDLEDLKTLGVVNPQNVSASYKAGDERTQKALKVTGAFGDQVKNPEAVVDGLFRQMAISAGKEKDGTKTSVEGTPQKVTPAGLDDGGVLKCQNMVMSGPAFAGHTIKTPMCIWADHSTVGTVIHMDASAIRTGVTPTADEAGAFAAQIRHDMRVEIPN
ncbi:hypothetical protein [Streptomyces sp. NPDC001404]|uniref:hypothetical protein n=1 Tax=Streptomyces sp. NPDC001404 TaxID=3364571 RepID=UPI0036753B5E